MAALLILTTPTRSVATEVKGLPLSTIKDKITSYISQTEEAKKAREVLRIDDNELEGALNDVIRKRKINEESEPQIQNDVECKLEDKSSYDDDNTSGEEAELEQVLDGDKEGYGIGVKSSKFASNYSRQKDPNYNFKKNYVQKVEDIPDASSLAIDAKHIHESSNEGTSYSTIFCVALRDQHGHIKKFVFHNGDGVMSPDCREKAKELGYDVIKSDQSHAEGEFLQFLFKRSLSDKYTHIIAMGCSRRHCIECDCLFRLILGTNYSEITAAVKPSEYSTVSITNITTDGFRVNKISGYKILQGKAAVSTGKPSPRFFIPVGLKELIEIHTGQPIVKLGPKYGGSETQEEQMDVD